jgi:hypothetical protein
VRLSFADSEVAGVRAQGDALVVRFAAAAVEGGYLLGLEMELQGAKSDDAIAACFGRLSGGSLRDAVTRFTSIDLPFDGPGPWTLELAFSQGQALRATAQHVRVDPAGARYQPSHAC